MWKFKCGFAMRRLRLLPRMAGVIGCAMVMATAAYAEDTSPPGWQFYLSPYIWVSSLTGTISTRNPNIPAQTATASFGNIFSHLNSVPLVGAAELRHDRFGLLTDLMVVSLSGSALTSGPAFSGVSATVTDLTATVLPIYRVLERDGQSLDLGVGARVKADWTKLSFASGVLPGFTRKNALSWADPIVGARFHVDLSQRFGLTVYGDVGGTSSSNYTWQATGTIDYRTNPWLVFHLGYRYLSTYYEANIPRLHTSLSGPLLGATFRF